MTSPGSAAMVSEETDLIYEGIATSAWSCPIYLPGFSKKLT